MNTAIETKSHPILFSPSMVQAIRDGRKTQTRRDLRWKNSTCLGYPSKSYWPNLHFDHAQFRRTSLVAALCGVSGDDIHLAVPWRHPDDGSIALKDCGKYAVRPIWQPGDTLWLRETCLMSGDDVMYADDEDYDTCYPKRGGKMNLWRVVTSIHMPRWASRITLEIVRVRVERLREISREDAIAEGIKERDGLLHGDRAFHLYDERPHWVRDPRVSYQTLWDSINGAGAFALNPWIWVIEFSVAAE